MATPARGAAGGASARRLRSPWRQAGGGIERLQLVVLLELAAGEGENLLDHPGELAALIEDGGAVLTDFGRLVGHAGGKIIGGGADGGEGRAELAGNDGGKLEGRFHGAGRAARGPSENPEIRGDEREHGETEQQIAAAHLRGGGFESTVAMLHLKLPDAAFHGWSGRDAGEIDARVKPERSEEHTSEL